MIASAEPSGSGVAATAAVSIAGAGTATRSAVASAARSSQNELDQRRVELRAGAAPQLRERLVLGVGLAVRARRDHRDERVADGDDARAERDLRAAQPIRVAVPVVALMGRADEPGDRAERGRGGEDRLADDRVLADQGPLLLGEGAGLVHDRVRDRDHADVAQLGGTGDLVDLLRRERQALGQLARQLADIAQGVEHALAPFLERAHQHVAHLAAGRGTAAGLLRVHALIGELERVSGVGGLERQVHGARRAADLEALAALVERDLGGGDDGVGPTGRRIDQRAELVTSDPVGAAVRPDRVGEALPEAREQRVIRRGARTCRCRS